MSREVRRVPLDFDTPVGETWPGYFLPDRLRGLPCSDCDNGQTPARQWVHAVLYLVLMLDDDLEDQARGRAIHPWLKNVALSPDARPSADIRDLGTGLAGRTSGFLGHDAIDHWNAESAVIKAAGLDPRQWGACPTCGGHGDLEVFEGQRDEASSWEAPEPPAGPGWQMWQTVSEGGPVSPVFATSEELAEWMRGDQWSHLSFKEALNFVENVQASFGSFVGTSTGVVDGTTAAAKS